MLQTVTPASTEKVYRLCSDYPQALLHTVAMGSDNNDDKNGGPNNLQAWRRFRGLTQAQLAEAVGTTPGMITHLESGERHLSAKWLRRLAPPLGTTPGFLLDHDPTEMPADILEIWNRAAPDQQQQIIALAETVIAFRPRTADDDLDALISKNLRKS
jgi:transcriptional regulator with XRE-family HTH domain